MRSRWHKEFFAITALLCLAASAQYFKAKNTESEGPRRIILMHTDAPAQTPRHSDDKALELSNRAQKIHKTVNVGSKSAKTQCNECSPKACAAAQRSTVWRACCRGGRGFRGVHPLLVTGAPRSATQAVREVLRGLGLELGGSSEMPGRDGSVSWVYAFNEGDDVNDPTNHAPYPFYGRGEPPEKAFRFKEVVHLVRDPLDTITSIGCSHLGEDAMFGLYVSRHFAGDVFAFRGKRNLVVGMKVWLEWNLFLDSLCAARVRVEELMQPEHGRARDAAATIFRAAGREAPEADAVAAAVGGLGRRVNAARRRATVSWEELFEEDSELAQRCLLLSLSYGYRYPLAFLRLQTTVKFLDPTTATHNRCYGPGTNKDYRLEPSQGFGAHSMSSHDNASALRVGGGDVGGLPKAGRVVEVRGRSERGECDLCSAEACAAAQRSTVWRACCRGGRGFRGVHPLLVTGAPRSATQAVREVLRGLGLELGGSSEMPGRDGSVSWVYAFNEGDDVNDPTNHAPYPFYGRGEPPEKAFRFKEVVHLVRDPLDTITSIGCSHLGEDAMFGLYVSRHFAGDVFAFRGKRNLVVGMKVWLEWNLFLDSLCAARVRVEELMQPEHGRARDAAATIFRAAGREAPEADAVAAAVGGLGRRVNAARRRATVSWEELFEEDSELAQRCLLLSLSYGYRYPAPASPYRRVRLNPTTAAVHKCSGQGITKDYWVTRYRFDRFLPSNHS